MLKEVKDFPGYYVSSEGFVKGKRVPRLKGKITWDGHEEVVLVHEHRRRNVRTHILIAEHFLVKPENKTQVNHKDGNKLNNCVDNLEYTDNSGNVRHAFINGLIKTKGRVICMLSEEELVEMFRMKQEGVNHSQIVKHFDLCCDPKYLWEIFTGKKLAELTKDLRSTTIPQGSRSEV